MHVSWYTWRSQRTALESALFPPWVPGMELRLTSVHSSVALHLIL